MLVLLIHGAYTSPWHWHRLIPYLEDAGCTAIAPELPCDDPEAGLEAYVTTVERATAEAGEPPLVVGSSFGAVTACLYASRHPVRGLVTVCGMVPRPGQPMDTDARCPGTGDAFERSSDGMTTSFRSEAARELIFHESEPELAREAADRLRPQANLPFTEPCPFERLPDVPRVGIVAPKDRLLRPEWLSMVVRERLGVEPLELDGDHGPMLSRPGQLAEILLATQG